MGFTISLLFQFKLWDENVLMHLFKKVLSRTCHKHPKLHNHTSFVIWVCVFPHSSWHKSPSTVVCNSF